MERIAVLARASRPVPGNTGEVQMKVRKAEHWHKRNIQYRSASIPENGVLLSYEQHIKYFASCFLLPTVFSAHQSWHPAEHTLQLLHQ